MNETQDFSLAEKITQECERTCTNLCSTFDDWERGSPPCSRAAQKPTLSRPTTL